MMSENARKKLITDIEALRGSKVITYVMTNRPNIRSDMDSTDVIRFREHLDAICGKCNKLDLFLYSYGGELEAAWEIANLFREYDMDFSVLVPYHCRSSATLLAMGAREIVMGKMGTLGPIDPTIRLNGGELNGMEISLADMDSYEDFLREEYQVVKPEEKIKAFEKLTESVSPILIGRAYRNYLETRDDASRLLQKYINDPHKVKKIVKFLLHGIHTHNHSVSRGEAKKMGLNISYADEKLEGLLWGLYKEYEKAMQMDIPYIDIPPKNREDREIPFTYIESDDITSKKVGLQRFKKLDFPKGSTLTAIEDSPAVYMPDGSTVPLWTDNDLILYENLIYEKSEDVYWVHE
jgi:ATP-dependent protease ClpP protease subunit